MQIYTSRWHDTRPQACIAITLPCVYPARLRRHYQNAKYNHICNIIIEPRHDKTNKMSVRPAKTQISLGICPVWSEFSLSAYRDNGCLATHWAHVAKTLVWLYIMSWQRERESSLCVQWVAKDPSFLHADSEDSDQTGRMPRLIWVFAGRTAT